MRRKLLTTTLISMSLLSLNLSAAGKMKCTGTHCFVDISGLSKKKTVKKPEIKSKKPVIEERYSTIILDDIETIVFEKEYYIMTDDEVGEYELEHHGIQELTTPVLSVDELPNSDYYCEDDLKPVKVEGLNNTYKCT